MIRISALYPNKPDSAFDSHYYLERHEPFATSLLTPYGLLSIRTTIGISSIDRSAPPFWAISEMVFVSRDHFDDAMAQCAERLFADISNYTNVSPILQVSELCDAGQFLTGA